MPLFGGGTVSPFPPSAVGISAFPTLTTLETLCLNFHDSLHRLHIGNKCGAYGAPTADCNVKYKVYQREGWIQALIDAQTMVERDIGRPLCASEICGETHPWMGQVVLVHKPIAYLGLKEWSDWNEVALFEGEDGQWCADICESDLPEGFAPELIQFSYPDSVLLCYRGLQALQIPCAKTLAGACAEGAENGYRFCWDKCQLIDPTADDANPDDPDHDGRFITEVKWRTYTLNTDLAVERVGECNCGCCTNGTVPTVSIIDADEGLVCIEGGCTCNQGRRLRFNYATAMDCYGRNDDLLRAVALLALASAGHTPSKPCNCDNTWLERMLSNDPTAMTTFSDKIRYGPTYAQMEAMRIINNYMKRPVIHRNVETGGLLTASGRKGRSKRLVW